MLSKCLFAVVVCFISVGSAGALNLEYELSGLLEDGTVFEGTLVLDDQAIDQSATSGFGEYEVVSHDFVITNTTVFDPGSNPSTSGRSVLAEYYLNEGAQRQTIYFEIAADTNNLVAFGEIVFDGFQGDADTFQPILTDNFVIGYVDNTGSPLFTDFSIRLVPEPSSLISLAAVGGLLLRRRSR